MTVMPSGPPILDASLGRDLVEAARLGDLDGVRRLLDLGISPSFQQRDGWHALHMAAMHGHEEVVRELLDRGFPVDLPNRAGSTALAEVVHQIGELALRARGLPFHLEGNDPEGGAPAPEAEERLYRVLHHLLERGADPMAGPTGEGAPLALARMYGIDRLEATLAPHAVPRT
jgi:ankyrin repeat protein